MTNILSQGELDPLSSASTEATRRDAPVAAQEPPPVVRYDFRRPDRVSKEQIHSLHVLHDRFARNVSTSMSAYLRTITELSLVSVDQVSYSEFLKSVADPTAFYALTTAPFDELGTLEINPAIAFAMIDRMLGGVGKAAMPNRALTEIEQHVVDQVVKLMLEALTEAWRPIVDLAFGIRGRETRPQLLQVAAPNETVLRVVFDMRVGEAQGPAHLCLPVSIVETSVSQFAQAWHRARREPTPLERGWMQESLSRVPVALDAMLEAHLSARELGAMSPGDVLSLGVAAHKPINLLVGNTVKFRGRLALDQGRVGVRIEQRCHGSVVMEA